MVGWAVLGWAVLGWAGLCWAVLCWAGLGCAGLCGSLCVDLRFKLYWPGLEEIFRQLC